MTADHAGKILTMIPELNSGLWQILNDFSPQWEAPYQDGFGKQQNFFLTFLKFLYARVYWKWQHDKQLVHEQ